MTNSQPDSYSLRILSPFSGTTRIIQRDCIRAISNDGVNWRLQIRATTSDQETTRYILFGLWNPGQGLTPFPVHPKQVTTTQQHEASAFVEALPEFLKTTSFPLRDSIECWLLDQEQQPLALILACRPEVRRPTVRDPKWVPCALDDHTFVSSHVLLPTRARDHSTPPIYHRDMVAQLIYQTAGQQRQSQWFSRQADGSGIGLEGTTGTEHLSGRHLPESAFPHFLVRQIWHNSDAQQLMDDFFHWQSPWLLSLTGLNPDERQQLERQACNYPRRLAAQYQLYPTIIDKTLINKTLIRAQFEKASPEKGDAT